MMDLEAIGHLKTVVGEFKYLEVDDGDDNSPEFEYLVGRWRYRSLTG